MDFNDELEKMFYDEIREKKKAATGVFHMRGKGVKGYIKGGMKTPVDYMKGKEKKEYTKGSVVVEYNIYDELDNIPKWRDLQKMEDSKIKAILEKVKGKFSGRLISTQLGVSNGKLYSLYEQYGLYVPKAVQEGEKNMETSKEFEKYADIKNVPSIDGLNAMDFETARKIITVAKQNNSIGILVKHWGISQYIMYSNLYKKYNIEIAERAARQDNGKSHASKTQTEQAQNKQGATVKDKTVNTMEVTQYQAPTLYDYSKLVDEIKADKNGELEQLKREKAELERKLAEAERLLKRDGFHVVFKGEYDCDFIGNRVLRILDTMDKGLIYSINLDIIEIKNEMTREGN